MGDLKKFLDAVMEMRAAQKLEWAALPANFDIWKRARQKQSISRLEQSVDELAERLLRTERSRPDDEGA
ncbi:MAG: hypothetical protein ACYC8T_35230 [Myxococcaceae bacterium]